MPAAERAEAASKLDRLAELIERNIDLSAVTEIAATAPAIAGPAWEAPRARRAQAPVVALAGGRAFTFRYTETEELLRAQGCQVVEFDPLTDAKLPAGTSAIYLGGGFPEVYAETLQANAPLKAELAAAIAAGMPTVAECAGLLLLAERVDGHRFVGAVPANASMHQRLTLGYRDAELGADSVLGERGLRLHGHEFHKTRTDPPAGELPAWFWGGLPDGFALDPAATGRATLHASYLHTHWAGQPRVAANFADAAEAFAASARGADWGGPPNPTTETAGARCCPGAPAAGSGSATGEPFDSDIEREGPQAMRAKLLPRDPLAFHGDQESAPHLIDFAVNVRLPGPPDWLRKAIDEQSSTLGAYPNPEPARRALAQRHGVAPEMVLPTAGAAEAFTLIAQALPGEVTILCPQFTEPEAAMRRAGRTVTHLLPASPAAPFAAGSAAPTDLLLVGNPTNPTGVLHSATELRAAQAKVLVVDEAFMDAVQGEPESLISSDMSGVLVVRSLTKTWGLAGIRAGYVIGDPALIAQLAAAQTPWSVGSHALAVMVATASDQAVALARAAAKEVADWRLSLVAGLRELGLAPLPSVAPFVLVGVGSGVHAKLRALGFAVRRAETFVGLDDAWIRIAVRDPGQTAALLRALAGLVEPQRQSEPTATKESLQGET